MPAVHPRTPPAQWRLSVEGAAAASALGIRAAGATLISSPEKKAAQTLALALGIPESAITLDPLFREADRVEHVHDGFRAARRAWVAGDLDARHTGWELPNAVARRFDAGLLAHSGDHLLVSTHGMALTAWMVACGLVAPGGAAVRFWEELRLPDVVTLGLSSSVDV